MATERNPSPSALTISPDWFLSAKSLRPRCGQSDATLDKLRVDLSSAGRSKRQRYSRWGGPTQVKKMTRKKSSI